LSRGNILPPLSEMFSMLAIHLPYANMTILVPFFRFSSSSEDVVGTT
jgi:hypothetical protein